MRNKQTVINAVVRRDTRVEIKQKKTRAKRGFPSHKSSPKKEREKQNVKERESKRA